jgi:hypothetical protein
VRADAANTVPAGFLAGSDAEAASSHFITSGKDGGCVLVGHTEDYAAYLPVAVRSFLRQQEAMRVSRVVARWQIAE